VSGSSTVEKIVGTSEPVDPGLTTLFRRIDRIVTIVMQHPKQALRMTVSHSAIDDQRTVTIDFELSGSGTETTDVVNPARLAKTHGLSIRGRPDKRAAEFQAGEVFGINVDNILALRRPSAEVNDQAFLQIRPTEARSFRATARLLVPGPQTYLIQLVYQNTTEYPERPKVLVGELVSKVIALRVPAMAR
jgi:hypothetical protein